MFDYLTVEVFIDYKEAWPGKRLTEPDFKAPDRVYHSLHCGAGD